jgi:purine nucleosidase
MARSAKTAKAKAVASTSRAIIIDTDPGQDDAVAILLALASPELEVLGITTVAGNVPLALTSLNARKICDVARRSDIPVCAGADRPMMRILETAEHVHGKTGLDGIELPEPSFALDPRHSVDFIIETVLARPPQSVTLCVLGPNTNVALALLREPRLKTLLREIVLMGGGLFEGGNITPAAEFNIYVDPEAAKIVLASGVPVVMIPLDATHQVLTTRARVAKIAALKTHAAEAVVSWIDFFERFDVAKYGSDGGPLHDPCVIAYLLKPELFEARHANVEIETASELTRGMTVADWWGVSGRAANCTYVRNVDANGFFVLLTERLATL